MPFGLKNKDIAQIHDVFYQYPQIQEVLIYGSRAKGNYKPGSDIDLSLIGKSIDLALLSNLSDQLDDLFLPYTFDISILRDISNLDFLDHIKRVGTTFYNKKQKH
ncbi:MAG: putative nucleotidyltransferase [Halioglobus sp.]|jgi:predicted nucleotidyltransferase